MSTKDSGHYIRTNESTRLPRRHVIVDTEARSLNVRGGCEQMWRCGVAAFALRTDAGQWSVKVEEYVDPGALWKDVDAFCQPGKRTVLWAHNLGYDLRVGQALKWLNGLGWELKDIRLAQQGTWARWARGTRALMCADSHSVWPTSLDEVATCFGVAKLPLPLGDDLGEWLARCRRDVEILVKAVTTYMDWLRSADMGSWQVTGAGQSFAAWRHKWMTHKILVADDFGARDAERRAMWCGRAEAYSWGENDTEVVYDYDWQNAYARIARAICVPVRQLSAARGLDFERLLGATRNQAVLADVVVQTTVPTVPTHHADGILWPVGRFETTLWDPELQLLRETNVRVEVRRAWLYRTAPALKAWAEWVMGRLHETDEVVPRWEKMILKHWSRTLIGRFAMRYRGWEKLALSPVDDLTMYVGTDVDTGADVEWMQIGRQVYERGEIQEGRDAVPSITGYVQSVARARLWRLMQLVGEEYVRYVDTDSVVVDRFGHKRIQELAGHPLTEGLRCKGRYQGWQIAGPRQLVLGGRPRVAGVPRGAVQTGPWRWEGEVWRGFGEAVRRGEADRVAVSRRVFTVTQVDKRRVRLPGGRTGPRELPA